MDNAAQPNSSQEIQQPLGAPQLPTSPTKKNLNWKGFFIGIIIVVLIEVVAFNMLKNNNEQKSSAPLPTVKPTISQKKPNPNSSLKANSNNQTNDILTWKTYSNTSFHVSFKYPNDWGVSNVDESTISINQLKGSSSPYIIGKSYTGTFAAFMPQTYIKSMTTEAISNPSYQINQYVITPQNTDPVNNAGKPLYITFVKNGAEQFVFEDYSGSKTLLSQILSTFKFTD